MLRWIIGTVQLAWVVTHQPLVLCRHHLMRPYFEGLCQRHLLRRIASAHYE